MVAAAAAKDFTNIFSPPPAADFASLLVGNDLRAFEKAVALFESDAATWRAMSFSTMARLKPAAGGLNESVGLDASVGATLLKAMKVVETGIKNFSKPMHNDPDVAQRLDRLATLSVSTGKFVRKLMRRIEKTRVAQYTTLVDLYYGLLAVQSELETSFDMAEKFDDPAKLGAYLRNQIAS